MNKNSLNTPSIRVYRIMNAEIYYILPNGKCSNCTELIRKTDKFDNRYTYYRIDGLKENKENGRIMGGCPKCKKFLELYF